MVVHFTDLDVFKKSYDISLEIHKESLLFPKIEQYALADQIRRSSKSICANIAEGFAKQKTSKADFKRFLLMALGSAYEVEVWIKYATDLTYLTQEKSTSWLEEYRSIQKMLSSFHSKV